jgi:hypothetical protein
MDTKGRVYNFLGIKKHILLSNGSGNHAHEKNNWMRKWYMVLLHIQLSHVWNYVGTVESTFSIFFNLIVLVVLGIKVSASCLLDRCSTTLATLPALFCVGYFRDRVSRTICLGFTSNHDPPDLCLLSSQDYKREPLTPGLTFREL